jgi:hypothetical protein
MLESAFYPASTPDMVFPIESMAIDFVLDSIAILEAYAYLLE